MKKWYLNFFLTSNFWVNQILTCQVQEVKINPSGNAKGHTDSGDHDDNLMTLRKFATENGLRKDEKTGEFLINPRGVNKFPYEDRQGTSKDMTRTPESSDQIQSTRPVASAPNPPHTETRVLNLT